MPASVGPQVRRMQRVQKEPNNSPSHRQLASQPRLELGEPLVDAEEIGAHYNVTGRYILKLAAQGRIPCLRLGVKCVRFRPREVALALENDRSISTNEKS